MASGGAAGIAAGSALIRISNNLKERRAFQRKVIFSVLTVLFSIGAIYLCLGLLGVQTNHLTLLGRHIYPIAANPQLLNLLRGASLAVGIGSFMLFRKYNKISKQKNDQQERAQHSVSSERQPVQPPMETFLSELGGISAKYESSSRILLELEENSFRDFKGDIILPQQSRAAETKIEQVAKYMDQILLDDQSPTWIKLKKLLPDLSLEKLKNDFRLLKEQYFIAKDRFMFFTLIKRVLPGPFYKCPESLKHNLDRIFDILKEDARTDAFMACSNAILSEWSEEEKVQFLKSFSEEIFRNAFNSFSEELSLKAYTLVPSPQNKLKAEVRLGGCGADGKKDVIINFSKRIQIQKSLGCSYEIEMSVAYNVLTKNYDMVAQEVWS